MDDFRKEVIKELEKKLGDDHKIFPQDRTKNNGFTAHGVCIRKKSENIGTVAYIDEAGSSTLFQTTFLRLFCLYCTGV